MEIRSASVLILNVIDQSNVLLAIFSRSDLISCAAEIGFSTIIKNTCIIRKTSYFRTHVFHYSIHIITEKAKIEPCGTPANMKFQLEDALGRTTFCLLLES